MNGRIIVTGARDYADVREVVDIIDAACMDLVKQGAEQINLSVGDCKTGADMLAYAHWQIMHKPRGKANVFIADWRNLGSAAGPSRNKRMINNGGNILLAFIKNCTKEGCQRFFGLPHISHGTYSTIVFADGAKIPTYQTPEKWVENYFKHPIYDENYFRKLINLAQVEEIFEKRYPRAFIPIIGD